MSQPAPAARPRPATDRDARHNENVQRVIGQVYELVDLGHVTTFTHAVEPHPHRPDYTVDVFRLVFADGRQAQLPYSQLRQYLRGFFAGRHFPRDRPGVPVAEVTTIRHRQH